MRYFKRALLILFMVVSCALTLTLSAAAYLLSRDHLHIPETWIHSAINRFAPETVRFAQISVEIQSRSFWDKQINLKLNDACLQLVQPDIESCIAEADLKARVALSQWTEVFYSLDQAFIKGLTVRADLSTPSPQSESSESFDMRSLGTYLRLVWEHVGTADIELAGAQIQTTSEYKAKAHLTKSAHAIKLIASEESTKFQGDFLVLESAAHALDAQLKASLPLPHQRLASLNLHLTSNDWQGFQFQSQLQNPDRHLPLHIQLSGSYRDSLLSTTLSVDARHLALRQDRLALQECPLKVHLEKREVHLSCAPSQLRYVLPRALFAELRTLHQSLDLKIANPPDSHNELTFALNWEAFDPHRLLNAHVQTRGLYNLKDNDLALRNLHDETFVSSVKIPRFERLVSYLKSTPFAIPAPANALNGLIQLEAHSERSAQELQVPFRLITRLTNPEQHLKTTTVGRAQLSFEPPYLQSVEVDSTLEDILVTLPKLGVTATPQLKPDPRFRKEEPTRQEQARFPFKLRVHTPHPRAVLIKSNLTGHPLPIGLDMTMTDELGLNGQLQVATTPLNVMKRDAQLEYFNLKVDPYTGRQLIDGKFLVTYANYRISILLMGTADEPRVQFDSQPPLDQQQIIAVLVFGRPLEELGDDQRGSVASMNSAVTEAALGLGSMYLLAATPIEQMTYNPDTHRVAARVRLKDDWSLDLSSRNSELSSIGLQRRLGAHWTLNTYTEQFDVSAAKKMKIFLQWFKRY